MFKPNLGSNFTNQRVDLGLFKEYFTKTTWFAACPRNKNDLYFKLLFHPAYSPDLAFCVYILIPAPDTSFSW